MSDSDRVDPPITPAPPPAPAPEAAMAPPAAAAATQPNPSAGIPGLSMFNGARALMLLGLLFFLLPWVTVSCADQTLVSMSGYDLATGSVTMHNPMTGESTRPPGSGEPDLPVILGAILIAAALLLSFVLKRDLATWSAIAMLAIAAAAISYTVLLRIPDKAREDATQQTAQGPPGASGATGIDTAQIAQMIRVETQSGFWLTLAALVAAIVFVWLARRSAPPG